MAFGSTASARLLVTATLSPGFLLSCGLPSLGEMLVLCATPRHRLTLPWPALSVVVVAHRLSQNVGAGPVEGLRHGEGAFPLRIP